MTNIVPLKKEQLANIKVASKRTLAHAENQHLLPIQAREFNQACTSYPIIIVKDPESDRFRTVVMLGLEGGENLYYEEEKWNAIYVPQSISMVPFALGLDPEKEKTLTACIDLDSPWVGEDKDMELFDAEGNETELTKGVRESLGRLYEDEVTTEKFIAELEENGLLMELELQINLANGENKKLVGLHGIDEQKLQELPDEKIVDFHKRGLFIPIHAMLASSGQINRLAQLRNLSASEVKVSGLRFARPEASE
ncbi:SapC family protein [Thalassotalea agarivorans]|uniref:SapC protein n=1 Tax=Thalassotalea agarivorans TaxID=349064 RepID=A0A1I0EC54_THASX|nr:SapC family protein [Thalassotalea agarivorans]SET42529.1 SapC protein [Thalassotalea agarivorans]